VTLDAPRTFKVNWSNVKCHNVLALKNAQIQARIAKLSKVKLGENHPRAYSATRNECFKAWSNTEIAITPPRIARLRSNFVQSFITSHAIRCKCSRSQRKAMYQQQKNTIIRQWISATSNGVVIKAGKGRAASSCNAFAIARFYTCQGDNVTNTA